jgi:hypothetical protein
MQAAAPWRSVIVSMYVFFQSGQNNDRRTFLATADRFEQRHSMCARIDIDDGNIDVVDLTLQHLKGWQLVLARRTLWPLCDATSAPAFASSASASTKRLLLFSLLHTNQDSARLGTTITGHSA